MENAIRDGGQSNFCFLHVLGWYVLCRIHRCVYIIRPKKKNSSLIILFFVVGQSNIRVCRLTFKSCGRFFSPDITYYVQPGSLLIAHSTRQLMSLNVFLFENRREKIKIRIEFNLLVRFQSIKRISKKQQE